MKIKNLLLLLVLAITLPLQAQQLQPQQKDTKKHLYKWRDANGNLVISDKPQPGAVEIPIKEVPVINIKESNLLDKMESQEDLMGYDNPRAQRNKTLSYEKLDYVSPQQDGVIRNNGAIIQLEASLKPALQKNHRIQFFLDGNPTGEPGTATSVTIEQAKYGPHSTFFQVIDSKGNLVQKSPLIKFALLHVVRKKKAAN